MVSPHARVQTSPEILLTPRRDASVFAPDLQLVTRYPLDRSIWTYNFDEEILSRYTQCVYSVDLFVRPCGVQVEGEGFPTITISLLVDTHIQQDKENQTLSRTERIPG